jgi:LAS superfamily LD-carboxypeptidase LdcB
LLPRRSLFLLFAALVVPAIGVAAPRRKRPKLKLEKIARGKYLEHEAAQAFRAMAEVARAEGIDLAVRSAHRSYSEQLALYRRYLGGKAPKAARPGTSRHEQGLAVDLRLTRGSPAHEWLRRNAGRFGFVQTVRSEPWHWEFARRKTFEV